MPFDNPVVAGQTLIRPSIRSANYVPGVSGWSINRDGSAEFASGTFRGPVIILDPTTGNVLASIGATGNGSFQNVAVVGDVVIGTQSVLAAITNNPRGIKAYTYLAAGTPPPSSGNGVFADNMWTRFLAEPNRLYKIYLTSLDMHDPGGPGSPSDKITHQLRVVASDGTFSGSIMDMTQEVIFEQGAIVCGLYRPTTSHTATVTWRSSAVGVVISYVNPSGVALIVDDIGPDVGSTGGTGSPSGLVTFTSTYVCTASRSYDGSGNPIGSPDQDNNCYQSGPASGRTHGNERAMIIIPGSTMRTDLAGATINSATLNMYCFASDDSSGSLTYRTEPNTAVPATYTPASSSDYWNYNNLWPLPGWHAVSMLDSGVGARLALTEILSNGANAIGIPQRTFGIHPTSMRGFGFDVTHRPFITVNYTK